MTSEIPGQLSFHLIVTHLSPLAYDFDLEKNIHAEGRVDTKVFLLSSLLL